MMKKAIIISILFSLMIIMAGCQSKNKITGDSVDVTMYKSPNCGCCVGHGAELSQNGFNVNTVPTSDMDSIKEKYNIPLEMRSCHTAIMGDYFVEGHVPIEAINKLLEEKPEVDGIALPRMPSGTPGMPGPKTETWIIYSLIDGKYTEFMRI